MYNKQDEIELLKLEDKKIRSSGETERLNSLQMKRLHAERAILEARDYKNLSLDEKIRLNDIQVVLDLKGTPEKMAAASQRFTDTLELLKQHVGYPKDPNTKMGRRTNPLA